MAENKKSVLLYCDIIHTVKELTNEEAGKLFKHYLDYVNDLNPKSDRLTELLFEPIKQNLKRDLKKWESILCKRSDAGKISAEKRKQNQHKSTHVKSVKQTSTNPTVIVNDIVTVNENVNDIKEKNIVKIQEKFYQSLTPFLDKFNKVEIRKFYDYWSEPNKSKTKIKWQLEKTWDTNKRLARWTNNKFNEKTITNNRKGFDSDSTRGAIEAVERIAEQYGQGNAFTQSDGD